LYFDLVAAKVALSNYFGGEEAYDHTMETLLWFHNRSASLTPSPIDYYAQGNRLEKLAHR